VKKPRPHDCAPPPCGFEDSERTETVPLHEATSAVGKDIRKSESLTVPTKAGNLPKGTRWREREAGSWNRRKER
jgi:hypothetical protein